MTDTLKNGWMRKYLESHSEGELEESVCFVERLKASHSALEMAETLSLGRIRDIESELLQLEALRAIMSLGNMHYSLRDIPASLLSMFEVDSDTYDQPYEVALPRETRRIVNAYYERWDLGSKRGLGPNPTVLFTGIPEHEGRYFAWATAVADFDYRMAYAESMVMSGGEAGKFAVGVWSHGEDLEDEVRGFCRQMAALSGWKGICAAMVEDDRSKLLLPAW